MSLDGSLSDIKVGGRLVRPATPEYAQSEYPELIEAILTGSAIVRAPVDATGSTYIVVDGPDLARWEMTRSDYDKCLSVLRQASTMVPFQPNRADMADRIRAIVRVEFADRSPR